MEGGIVGEVSIPLAHYISHTHITIVTEKLLSVSVIYLLIKIIGFSPSITRETRPLIYVILLNEQPLSIHGGILGS